MTASPKRVPARYFALLLGSLGMQGVDTARLLRLAALDARRFERGDDMLTPAEIESFLVAASHVTERTDLGFEMGRLIKLNSHDQLGYGMLSCRDLDQLLRLTSRYYHLIIELFTLRFRRTPEGGEAVFNPVAAMPLRTMRFAIEAIAVSVQNQFGMLLGPPGTAFDFYMGMPPPPHQARYLELLPARFHFDERALPGITLRLDTRLLERPLPMASPQLVEQIEGRLQSLQRRPAPHAGWGDYITMLLREAQGQQVTLDDIARRMNISARTIDRSLKKENLQFRDLSQKVRFERARERLANPRIAVGRVAEELGFSDAANFSRAFKRHCGLTPSEFQANTASRDERRDGEAGGSGVSL